MATIHIYLIPRFNRTFFDFGEGGMYATGLIINEYFGSACEGLSGFDGADFHWEGDASRVGATDLVCYVLGDQGSSIVQYHADGPLGGGGSTAWSTRSHKMISEVYMQAIDGDRSRYRLLANLIFHELMHNKLDAHPSMSVVSNVHTIRGGTISRIPVNSSMRPSSGDLSAMRRGIPLAIPQYTRRF